MVVEAERFVDVVAAELLSDVLVQAATTMIITPMVANVSRTRRSGRDRQHEVPPAPSEERLMASD